MIAGRLAEIGFTDLPKTTDFRHFFTFLLDFSVKMWYNYSIRNRGCWTHPPVQNRKRLNFGIAFLILPETPAEVNPK